MDRMATTLVYACRSSAFLPSREYGRLSVVPGTWRAIRSCSMSAI